MIHPCFRPLPPPHTHNLFLLDLLVFLCFHSDTDLKVEVYGSNRFTAPHPLRLIVSCIAGQLCVCFVLNTIGYTLQTLLRATYAAFMSLLPGAAAIGPLVLLLRDAEHFDPFFANACAGCAQRLMETQV